MGWAISVAGALLIAGTLWDALTTTVNVSERVGHLARGVFALLRRPLAAAVPAAARPSAALLQIVLLIVTWLGLLWLGWFALLLGSPAEFVHGVTGEPAGTLDTLYVAGFGVFALGVGDIGPASPTAQVLLVVSAATGLVLVTLVVTYLLLLTQAATHKRHVARLVRSLGDSAEDIVRHAWDGSSFQPATTPLHDIARGLTLLAEHQVTFPILYQFGTHRSELTLGSRLVDILDAIHLMRAASPPARLPEVTSHQLRTGLRELVRAIPGLQEQQELTPEPDLGVLRDLGVPPRDTEARHLDASLRGDLHALASREGWPKTSEEGEAG